MRAKSLNKVPFEATDCQNASNTGVVIITGMTLEAVLEVRG